MAYNFSATTVRLIYTDVLNNCRQNELKLIKQS